MHNKEKKLKCPKCSKSFHLKQHLEAHLGSKHKPGVLREFKCSQCEETFPTLNGLRLHNETQHPRPSTSGMTDNKSKKKTKKPTATKRVLTGILLLLNISL